MKRTRFILAIATVLMLCSHAAVAGVIENGSFEEPGKVLWPPLTPNNCPNDWNDINLPASKFSGWVSTEWKSDGTYSLTLFSLGGKVFNVNEIGMISQHVPLTREVNEIIFDIRLYTSSGAWDPNMRRAVVCIDGEVVWESNDVGSDVRGVYYDQNFVVPEKYKDGQPHRLSLGVRIDSNTLTSIAYKTDWDYVDSTAYCDDLATDLNHDCYVDFFDLAMLVDVWLAEVQPNDERNLFRNDDLDPNGFINFYDFAVYASTYTGNMGGLAGLTDVWLEEVEPDNEYNLYTNDDLPNGVINFFDFTVFAEDWLYSSYDE